MSGCELLVRVVDKINHECPYLDSKCTKRGDVIVAAPLGWEWGKSEVNDPQYRILRLPLVPLSVGEALLGREHDTDPSNPSRVLQKRAFRLDLDRLPQEVAAMTAYELNAIKVRKPALDDPNVFGSA